MSPAFTGHDSSVVSVSASGAVGHRSVPQPHHTIDDKNSTGSSLVDQCSQQMVVSGGYKKAGVTVKALQSVNM